MDSITGSTSRGSASSDASSAALAQASEVRPRPVQSAGTSPTRLTYADTVETSGHAIMVSRIFQSASPSLYLRPGEGGASGSIYSFLTGQDRTALATLYDYAQIHDVNPRDIDAVAFDLGGYRSTRREIVHPAPVRYDSTGSVPRPAAFSDEDEIIAQRILTSKAIRSSALPEDFLRTRLDPAFSEGHAANLGVLEKVIYATSRDGAATDPNAVIPLRPKDYFETALAELNRPVAPADPSERTDATRRQVRELVASSTIFDDLDPAKLRQETLRTILTQLYAPQQDTSSRRPRHH